MIYKCNEKSNNYFFESRDIKVFPCSYRGYYTTEDNNNYTFDPESRLNTEYNFVNLPGFNGHDSYIISYIDNILKCVIGGYYFEINLAQIFNIINKTGVKTKEELEFLESLKGACLYIKTKNINLVAEENNYDVTRNTAILSSFEDVSAVKLDTYIEKASNKIDEVSTYLFTGLVLGNLSNNFSAKLELFNEDFDADNKLTLNKKEQLPMLYHGAGNQSIVLDPETNIAAAERSIALGYNTIASQENQVVVGQYNSAVEGEFIVGNGTAAVNNRKNSFVVNKNTTNINNSLKIVDSVIKNGITNLDEYVSINPSALNLKTKAISILDKDDLNKTVLLIDNQTANKVELRNINSSQHLILDTSKTELKYSEEAIFKLEPTKACLTANTTTVNSNTINLGATEKGTVIINGSLNVSDNTTISKDLAVMGDLEISNDTLLNGELKVIEATSLESKLIVKKETLLEDSLKVIGNVTLPSLTSTTTANKMTKDLYIEANLVTQGSLNAGSSSFDNATINNYLKVAGKATFGSLKSNTIINNNSITTGDITTDTLTTTSINSTMSKCIYDFKSIGTDDKNSINFNSAGCQIWSNGQSINLLDDSGRTHLDLLTITRPRNLNLPNTRLLNVLANDPQIDESLFYVTASGNVGVYNELTAYSFNAKSDRRLKENIKPFKSEKSILDLPIYKYDYINGAKNNIGCIAQELQELYPELVSENEEGYLTVKESKLVYLLLEEVKKLNKRIKTLEKGIN